MLCFSSVWLFYCYCFLSFIDLIVFVLFMINVYVNNKINLLELELYVNVYNRCYVLENMCD